MDRDADRSCSNSGITISIPGAFRIRLRRNPQREINVCVQSPTGRSAVVIETVRSAMDVPAGDGNALSNRALPEYHTTPAPSQHGGDRAMND